MREEEMGQALEVRKLTDEQFKGLAEVPPEVEWFANIGNANTRKAYREDVSDFSAFVGITRPEEFRVVTRAHVIAWRDELKRRELAAATIRRKLSALSSLFSYLCNENALGHNPVTGVARPSEGANEGKTPAIGDAQARALLLAPAEETLKGKRDRAILATLETLGQVWPDGAADQAKPTNHRRRTEDSDVAIPFYVSPEQMMKDRAEYARKGIARGRALVAVEYQHGVVFVSENPSRSLYKTSEIYDRIAFAAVGRYNEFESLRVAGIRLADVKGYQYAREDVTAKALANAYSQALGAAFMGGEAKPFEVELLIAEVEGHTAPADPGEDAATSLELYHILYDGSIVDEHKFVAIGGESEALSSALQEGWEPGLDRDAAVRTGVQALGQIANRDIAAGDLEVAGLDATRPRRRYFRLRDAALAAALEAPS
jgi:proteasome alpha subunit